MIFFLIRHKATKEYMPHGKRDRGYTHWNPANQTEPFYGKMKIPRLIETRKKAEKIISLWASMPNAERKMNVSYLGSDTESLDTKPDGRKKEDLEIVEVRIFPRQAIE